MISFGSFFIPYCTVEGPPCVQWFSVASLTRGSCPGTDGFSPGALQQLPAADKWAAVLLALGAFSELWSLEGDFDFSVLTVTRAVVPDLVIKFVPTLSLALRAGCGGCLAGAAPKRSPSTGAFDWNNMRTEQAGVIPDSSICCMKCKFARGSTFSASNYSIAL